jgi:hypothetical protein
MSLGSFIREYFGQTAHHIADFYWPFLLPLPMFLFLKQKLIVRGIGYYLAGLCLWLLFVNYLGMSILIPVFGYFVFGVIVLVPWGWAFILFRFLHKNATPA